jgi:hypothetical protein
MSFSALAGYQLLVRKKDQGERVQLLFYCGRRTAEKISGQIV